MRHSPLTGHYCQWLTLQLAVPTSSLLLWQHRQLIPLPTLQIISLLSLLTRELTSIRHQQQALSQSFSRLESSLSQQHLADYQDLHQQLASLSQQQTSLAAQLPQAPLFDLLSQLLNLNQLPSLLRNLNSSVNKLSPPS